MSINWDKVFQDVSLKELKKFVIKHGWTQVDVFNDELVFFTKPDNPKQDIVLPLRKNIQNYTFTMLELLGDLKEFAGASVFSLLKKLRL